MKCKCGAEMKPLFTSWYCTAECDKLCDTQPTLLVVDNADGTLTLTHQWAGAGGNGKLTRASLLFVAAAMTEMIATVYRGSYPSPTPVLPELF